MPALTFPDIASNDDDTTYTPFPRDPLNPYPRSPPHPHRHPDAVYAHTHFDSTDSNPHYDRIYSSHHFATIPPSSAVFAHFALPHSSVNWQPHYPPFHHNPYPPPPPPQLAHKVWILDCRSCGTFITNRGMKAVLLLRPNVSLFSTDALPVNCSAYSTNPDALRPPPCRPHIAPSASRTCECLTQTLCCHTCGTAIGYVIVIPCSRCTSSISTTNRATNGHRFVFHSSEIAASERHHIPDEPGVLPVEYPTPPPPPSSPPPLALAYPAVFPSDDLVVHRQPGGSVPLHALQSLPTSSPSSGSDDPPSSEMEAPDSAPSSLRSSPDFLASVPQTSFRRSPRPLLQMPHDLIPQPSETRGSNPELSPRKLRAGDVLYWHHLTKHGEIPGVEEDPRARIPKQRDVLNFLER